MNVAGSRQRENRTALLRAYRTMLLIRFFEQKVEELFARGVIRGTAHAAIGQEAVAVGVCSALRKDDFITSTHRGHGHFIARGADPRRIMAELYGKKTGYSRGRGGSQLMADFSMGFLGANGITGGSIPLATGVALAMKLQGGKRIVACIFGDGASNQGTFHESLNMAGIWNLPIVYVCENNMYAMSMRVSNAVACSAIAHRAAGYGFSGGVVDGNDVLAVQAAVAEAAEKARSLHRPTLVECRTYRLSGHSRGDPRIYRSGEEEQAAWNKDPIRLLRKRLIRQKLLARETDAKIAGAARRAIKEAVAFAEKSPEPDPRTLQEGVYA